MGADKAVFCFFDFFDFELFDRAPAQVCTLKLVKKLASLTSKLQADEALRTSWHWSQNSHPSAAELI